VTALATLGVASVAIGVLGVGAAALLAARMPEPLHRLRAESEPPVVREDPAEAP
jgi:hypothetical protein